MPLRFKAPGDVSLVIPDETSIACGVPVPAATCSAVTSKIVDLVESVAKTLPCSSRSRSLMKPPPVLKTFGAAVGLARSQTRICPVEAPAT